MSGAPSASTGSARVMGAALCVALALGVAPPAFATDDAPRVEPPPSVKRRQPPPDRGAKPDKETDPDAATKPDAGAKPGRGAKRGGPKADRSKRGDARPPRSKREGDRSRSKGARGSRGTSLGRVSQFPPGTPLGLVRDAFRCALRHDFDCYAALNVSHNTDSPHARRHLRKYSWAAFENRATGYVLQDEPFTLHAVRYDPPRVDDKTKRVKVYLLSRDREYPAPITLVRSGTYWRVYTNSL